MYCYTPSSALSASQNKKKYKSGKLGLSASDLKRKRQETYYVNTITNNYYQVKRKNGQVGETGKNADSGSKGALPEDCTPASVNSVMKRQQ